MSHDAGDLRRELAAFEYETKTRDKRFVPAAKPLGEGRCQLLRHRDHTEFAYALELPKHVGPAQQEFEIRKRRVTSSRSRIPKSGAGCTIDKRQARISERLRRKFGHHRWIDAEPDLLDDENAQQLLLAAHSREVETELGIHIDTEDGETFDQKSRYERHMASAHRPHAVTAADLENALACIDLPKTRHELVEDATSRLPPDSEVLRVIHSLPARTYRTAADVAKAFGELRSR